MKETKDFYSNPLNKIKWGPDERSASDFALNSYKHPPSIDRKSELEAKAAALKKTKIPVSEIVVSWRVKVTCCCFFIFWFKCKKHRTTEYI